MDAGERDDGLRRADRVVDLNEARRRLDAIMRHHARRGGWTYPDEMPSRTLVWCVEVDRLTAKAHRIEGEGRR
jgi:hypothetical protein